MSADPSVLSDNQLALICADLLELHAENIFVVGEDGRALIAEIRRRCEGTAPPTRTELHGGDA